MSSLLEIQRSFELIASIQKPEAGALPQAKQLRSFDTVSIRPVSYAHVLALDKALYRLARALVSPIPADMPLGVLSVLILTLFYHIRFTLHRPHATALATTPPPPPPKKGDLASSGKGGVEGPPPLQKAQSQSQSHERHARTARRPPPPRRRRRSRLGLQLHALGPVPLLLCDHVLRAAARGGSRAAKYGSLPRERAPRVRAAGVLIADKAGDMLTTLSPLYGPDVGSSPGEGDEARRAQASRSSAGSPGALSRAFPAGFPGATPGLPTPPPSAAAGGKDVAMWGTSVGFGQGDWARFLDVMQRTEASGLMSA
ncbi:hypothetical protein DFH11DRAFT_1836279 [Phellopilus nigrolimitatus]|nr:hypothetical protein DFH11DRAFT_1836279 [Phellopilus nigrolimitatus]